MWKNQWFNDFIKVDKVKLFLSIFTLFLITFSTLALMFTSGFLISRSAQRPENILLVYVPIVLTRTFGISRPVFRYIQRLISHNWVLRIVSLSRKKLFTLVEENTSIVNRGQDTSQTLSYLNNDIEKLQNFYLRTVFPIMSGVFMYLFLLIFSGFFSTYLFIFWLIFIILIGILLPILMYKLAKEKTLILKEKQNDYFNNSAKLVNGNILWQLTGNKQIIAENKIKFQNFNQENKNGRLLGWKRDFIIEIAVLIGIVIILVLTGKLVASRGLNENLIAAFVLSTMAIVETFISVNAGSMEVSYYMDSFNKLNELKSKPETRNLSKNKKFDIRIENLDFSYDNKKNVLKNINLLIPEKQNIALIGKSGSGKSTLIKLIAGDISPTRGDVFIGNENIMEINEILSNKISILDQSTYLFNKTIAQNIALVNPTISDKQINQYLNIAGLANLIKKLPDGINTPMQEFGNRFSGGEQQRFALARTLAKNSSIVILDEPTVGLDPITEKKVIDDIFKALKNKTVIWITHHQIGLANADLVYEIKNNSLIKINKSSQNDK
ncbi:MAG: thiol reductant ABC exporter subunit CydC [Lactobacillaceae bacterium]|jgi:ATP-binding cassette subfamily C protein CydC|nr:thiol reductant ABC exporter subunit CydC [Lactobacillaceae bacterium]